MVFSAATVSARSVRFSFFGEILLRSPAEVPTIYRIWQKHEIEAGFREELMLTVSKLNDCKYCAWGHHEWAHAAGISEDELDHIEHGDSEGIEPGQVGGDLLRCRPRNAGIQHECSTVN